MVTQGSIKLNLCLHVVEEAENDPEQHLEYPQDDSHLHLVRVGVEQLVLCHIPSLV